MVIFLGEGLGQVGTEGKYQSFDGEGQAPWYELRMAAGGHDCRLWEL
jgi:hypothetical protein